MSKLKVSLQVFVVLLVIILAVPAIARYMFNHKVENEINELMGKVKHRDNVISMEDLAKLPPNVSKWLEYAGVVGKADIVSVYVKQVADMRLENDKPWMPVEAEQYFTVDEPGFIWQANIKAAPLFHISGRDKYEHGEGNMLIKLLSLIPVADSTGREIDQGTLLRFLAESIWFPTSALHDYLTWQELDQYHAKATMTYGGITASGVFTFNEIGQVVSFEAERYGEFDGELRLETWSIPVSEYKQFEGIQIPTKGDVTWKLAEGDFNWFNFEVIEVKYNQLLSSLH